MPEEEIQDLYVDVACIKCDRTYEELSVIVEWAKFYAVKSQLCIWCDPEAEKQSCVRVLRSAS